MKNCFIKKKSDLVDCININLFKIKDNYDEQFIENKLMNNVNYIKLLKVEDEMK